MIEIVEQIIGIELGQTCYDDVIVTGALFLGVTAILIFIQILKAIFQSFV